MSLQKTKAARVSKYILEDGKILLGWVYYSADLITNKKKVIGGGMYKLNRKDKTLYLFGKSHRIGGVPTEDLVSAVEAGKVYTVVKNKTKLEADFTIYIKTKDQGTITLKTK